MWNHRYTAHAALAAIANAVIPPLDICRLTAWCDLTGADAMCQLADAAGNDTRLRSRIATLFDRNGRFQPNRLARATA